MTPVLTTGPKDAAIAILLAHGAGAPMDSPFLNTLAATLANANVSTTRFEFAYMAERRITGIRRPPPKIDILA